MEAKNQKRDDTCGFCGRTSSQSGLRVVTGKFGGAICEECVRTVGEILNEEPLRV